MKESRQKIQGTIPISQESLETGAPGSNDPQDDERLRFETLVTDLSSCICAVSPDEMDNEIELALRRICEGLGMDLCAVWQWEDGNPAFLVMTHLYRAYDGPPTPDRMEASEYFPWSFQQVLACKTVIMSSADDMPPEAARDVEVWGHFGVKSTLTVPLIVGDEPPFGAISFNDLVSPRVWTDTLVQRLQMVVQILANGIVRKRKEQALRRSKARLQLAADSAGTGLWSLNFQTRRFWATDRARRMFGFGPEEIITYDRFAEMVHPEDREFVDVIPEEVLKTKEGVNVEYRVLRNDGEVRWMASQGCLQQVSPGKEVSVLLGATRDITERKAVENELRQAFEEVKDLRARLQKENAYLKKQIRDESGHKEFVGQSDPVKQMIAMAENVAATETTLLITGETGTGKELLAQLIHDLSAHSLRAMVKVNCAALPGPLIESELFGREKGAFTGAMTRQIGRFEVANGSTIMLDEIGELPLELQTKLLGVLEGGKFERLGSNQELTTDARIIAATNRDLPAMVARGEFREDLFHRLNVFPIAVPPLRDRTEDIPLLVWHFVKDFNMKMGRSVESVPPSTMQRMIDFHWPGNVRELRNVIERAMILSAGRTLEMELPDTETNRESLPMTIEDLERNHIRQVLNRVHWRISGKGGAAEILGLVPTTLHSRMKKLGIKRPRS